MSFKKELEKYKEFYFKEFKQENGIFCPCFGEKISVGWSGWKHIVFNSRRGRKEVLDRLDLLKLGKKLLENSPFYQSNRKENDGKIEFWGLEGFVEGKKIRVIIRSVNGGQRHFFSIFEAIEKGHNRKKEQ